MKQKGCAIYLKISLLPEKSDENFALVVEDRNALFHALKNIPPGFKEICLKLFGMVCSKTCNLIFSTEIYHPDFVKFMKDA